jgi:hypothetical protein
LKWPLQGGEVMIRINYYNPALDDAMSAVVVGRIDGILRRYCDLDGVFASNDAFPNDASASVVTNDDGASDRWNDGYNAEDSTTGLVFDQFPDDFSEQLNSDGDGFGDNAAQIVDPDNDVALWKAIMWLVVAPRLPHRKASCFAFKPAR